MAPFSYHSRISCSPDFAAYLPSCLSPFLPSLPSPLLQAADEAIGPSSFLCYNQYHSLDEAASSDIFPAEISTFDAAGTDAIRAANTTIPTPASSSSTLETSGMPKGRKPKKRSGAAQKPPREIPAAGFIHVRARRGEATDSHSLAERVRREKIREKMRTLQDLVPGCDKVVGKALLLEEIISYVQSLQNQVQFLSMKLAFMDPIFHDGGFSFLDYLILQEELENTSRGLPAVAQGTGQTDQPMASADAANGDPVHDASVPILLHEEEGPPAATFPRSRMETAPCGNSGSV